MTAAGVCHSDLHVVDGEWDRPAEIVLGHEGAFGGRDIVRLCAQHTASPRFIAAKLCEYYVTQDLAITLLGDEEEHRRQFVGFLKEYEG